MKKTLVLSLLFICLLALASITAFAADVNKGVITINGGNQAVYVGQHGKITTHKPPTKTIYSNFSSGNTYNGNSGWTVSDGSTLGEEFTAANSFVLKKNATLHNITAALSLAGGTGASYVQVVKDCKGEPCKVDYQGKGTICHALAKITQPFGDCCAVVKVKCSAKLKAKTHYWIVMEAVDTDNTFAVWDWSDASNADGPDSYSLNDAAWVSNGSSNPQGAFSLE